MNGTWIYDPVSDGPAKHSRTQSMARRAAGLVEKCLWINNQRERAALARTEALTGMIGRGVSEASYANLSTQFTQTELVFLTTAIAVINSWNRLGVAFRFSPPVPNRGAGEWTGRLFFQCGA